MASPSIYSLLSQITDRAVNGALRLVADNLASLWARLLGVEEKVAKVATPLTIQQIRASLQANGPTPLPITGLPGAGASVSVGTHATRPAASAVGNLYAESDRRVIYVTELIAAAPAWVYNGGTFEATLANRPTDLSTNDTGFLFYATDNYTKYVWTGAVWVTVGGALWQATVDSVTAAQWKQTAGGGGAVILDLDTTNKRVGVNVTAPNEDLHILGDIAFHGAGGANRQRIVSTAPTATRTFTLPNADSNSVQPDTGSANNFLTAIAATGVISKAQPSAANLSNGTVGTGAVVLATAATLVRASSSALAQTGAVASVATYTTGGGGGSFEIGGYINVTAFTGGTVSMAVDYTDPAGGAQTLIVPLVALAGTISTTVGSATDAQAVVVSLQTSGANAITIKTTVTIFVGTYNVYGWIKQIA